MDSKQLSKILEILKMWRKDVQKPVVEAVKENNSDPFLILIATILSLRTRDQVTREAFSKLHKKVKNVHDLLKIDEGELEEIIHPVGFYRNKVKTLKEIARILTQKFGGKVPDNLEELLSIKGVGRKTANLVLIEGFNKDGICVDTHVHRILNWWGYVKTKTPDETEMALRKKLPKKWWKEINAILVTFGQNLCKPVAPRCNLCPVNHLCTYPKKQILRRDKKTT